MLQQNLKGQHDQTGCNHAKPDYLMQYTTVVYMKKKLYVVTPKKEKHGYNSSMHSNGNCSRWKLKQGAC